MKKVFLFSPLPPLESGVALYSHLVATELARAGNLDVTVVVGQTQVPPDRIYQTLHWSHFLYRPLDPEAVLIYQLGNHPMHGFLYPFLYTHRGIVVLHDYILGHGRLPLLQKAHHPEEVSQELAMDLGSRQGKHLANLLDMQISWPQLPFWARLNRSVVASALMTVTHNPDTARILRQENPDLEIAYLPMGFGEEPVHQITESARIARRRSAGIPDDAVLIGAFGAFNPNKHSDQLLMAGKRLREIGIPACLLFGGYRNSSSVARTAQALGIQFSVRIAADLSRQEYWEWIGASDVCCSLRYPSAGECSLSLIETMAAGRPVIVNRHRFNAYLPDDVCFKVGTGSSTDELVRAIRVLLENDSLRRNIAARAREYVRKHHSLDAMMRSYRKLIEDCETGDRKTGSGSERMPRHLRPLSERAMAEVEERFPSSLPRFLRNEMEDVFSRNHS